MTRVSIAALVLCITAGTAIADAQTFTVRVVRDVPYLQGANYADDKDKLDLYLPDGRRNAPVIVSYYGNQLMGGDKSEDAYIGRRFASAGFVTAVVSHDRWPQPRHDLVARRRWRGRHRRAHHPLRVALNRRAGAALRRGHA